MTSPEHTPRSDPASEVAGENRSRFARWRQELWFSIFATSLLIAVLSFLTAWRLGGALGNVYDLDIFLHQFIVHETSGALLAAAVLGLGFLLSIRVSDSSIEKVVLFFASSPWVIAIATLPLLVFGSLVVYRNHPLAMDEYMPFFQAQIFAEGEIYGRFPPDLIDRLIPKDFLNSKFIAAGLTSGKVVSTYAPGFALLLTPFMALGVPWLLNPLLGAGTLLVVHHLARRLYDDPRAPGWAMLLILASPAFTVNAISYYSLPAHLFLNLVFVALLLDRGRRRRRPYANSPLTFAFAAGIVGSLALNLSNPVPHALFALPWLLWFLIQRRWRTLAALALGYLPLCLILGIGWVQVRGGITAENVAENMAEVVTPAVAAVADEASGGFWAIARELRSFLGVLQVPDAEFLGLRYLATLKLFMWVAPGLPLLALLGYQRIQRQEGGQSPKVPAQLLGASAVVTFVFYLFVYFDQGHGWGYRYFQPALGVLPLLGVAALLPAASSRLRRLVGVAALLSLLAGTAYRFDQVHSFISRHLGQIATAEEDGPQVRFVYLEHGYYIEDLIQNDPFLRGPVWTLISHGTLSDVELIRNVVPGARLAVDRVNSTAWIVE